MARTTFKRSSSQTGNSNISASQDQVVDAIRKKAYELYEKRGKKQGHAMNDWLEAEHIVKQRSF